MADPKARVKYIGVWCLQTSNIVLNPTGKHETSRRVEGGDRKAFHPDDAKNILKIERDGEPCFTDDKKVFQKWVKENKIVIRPVPTTQPEQDLTKEGGFKEAFKAKVMPKK